MIGPNQAAAFNQRRGRECISSQDEGTIGSIHAEPLRCAVRGARGSVNLREA
jgi:hypothetical protein